MEHEREIHPQYPETVLGVLELVVAVFEMRTDVISYKRNVSSKAR